MFERLSDREWHGVGELFNHVQELIPMHMAMRIATKRSRRLARPDELPTVSEARWHTLKAYLSTIGVETEGREDDDRRGNHAWKWDARVRLRYVSGRCCEHCGGPVIKASWATGYGMQDPQKARVACVQCGEAGRTREAGTSVKINVDRPLCGFGNMTRLCTTLGKSLMPQRSHRNGGRIPYRKAS
jgi:hypothetical protein